MIRPLLGDDPVGRGQAENLLRPLLKQRLVVALVTVAGNVQDLVVDISQDKAARGLKPSILVDRSNHGLENIRQQ